jgi:hypothetical protein
MYACNMYRIPVPPPSPSASRRRSLSSEGRRASAPRLDASPCACRRHQVRACARWPRVASSRPRKRSLHVGAAVPALSGEAGGEAGVAAKGGLVKRKMEPGERVAVVVVDHAVIRGGAGEWRSRLCECIFLQTSGVDLLRARQNGPFGPSRPTTTRVSRFPNALSRAFLIQQRVVWWLL